MSRSTFIQGDIAALMLTEVGNRRTVSPHSFSAPGAMISQTAEYALRAVTFLAQQTDSPVARSQIAGATEIPISYLHKVLRELDRAGVVSSQRGPGGGYRLAIPANKLTVYDVVSLVDETSRISVCPLGLPNHHQLCPLHRKLDDTAAAVEQAFRTTWISDILPKRNAVQSCQFPKSNDDGGANESGRPTEARNSFASRQPRDAMIRAAFKKTP